jgi:hypothetical protein
MSEEQLNASLDAEGAKPVEEEAEDVELTDEELAGVAGGQSQLRQQQTEPEGNFKKNLTTLKETLTTLKETLTQES